MKMDPPPGPEEFFFRSQFRSRGEAAVHTTSGRGLAPPRRANRSSVVSRAPGGSPPLLGALRDRRAITLMGRTKWPRKVGNSELFLL
jgi:hypothetical protein